MNARLKAIRMGVVCGLLLCLASTPVLAHTHTATSKRRASVPASTAAASTLKLRQDEVARLRRQVDSLEASNQQTASKLQQQDRDIAELRRQLQALPAPATSVH